jgi:hypothetical protein
MQRNGSRGGSVNLQNMLEGLLLWGLYPLWLLAGAGDYLCHRQTDIEHTSGSKESWFHVLQFLCLLVAFSAAVLLNTNVVVFAIIVAAVLSHSLLTFFDVAYTDGRRYISPVEQYVHGFMDVLPWAATAIFGVLHASEIRAEVTSHVFVLRPSLDIEHVLLVGSFAVLAGVPILEELARTRRHRFERAQRLQTGLAAIK